jgi:hypothetical protein
MTNKPRNRPKAKPTWSDVKDRLADFDHARLLELVADLYAFHSDNKSFLHARFGLGANPLDDYKRRIGMALAPDVFRKPNADPSVATAKRAIAEYAKAVADPLGLLELRVFWCETAVGFSMEFGFADERYLDALLRQFRDASQALSAVDEPLLGEYIGRLEAVRDKAQMGYGVQEEMSDLLGER